jgi:hypothetical protein
VSDFITVEEFKAGRKILTGPQMLAKEAEIEMTECRLLEENGGTHL